MSDEINGKEVLENILKSPTAKARGGSYLDIELIKSIKQDLDRLEQLEDNINIHKGTIKMQQSQIESLHHEIQKLKEIIKENFDYNRFGVFFIYNAPVMEYEIKEVLNND